MKVADLVKDMPVKTITGDTGIEVTGLTKDSRAVQEGSVFFVTKKSELFMAEALKRGQSNCSGKRTGDRSAMPDFDGRCAGAPWENGLQVLRYAINKASCYRYNGYKRQNNNNISH
jgi:hypothetical protein